MIIALIVFGVIFVGLIIVLFAYSISNKGISVIEKSLVTELVQTDLSSTYIPIALVKIKNTSKRTKSVRLEVKFYSKGTFLGYGLSNFVELLPDDEAYLNIQSNNGYNDWLIKECTFKITKRKVYNSIYN